MSLPLGPPTLPSNRRGEGNVLGVMCNPRPYGLAGGRVARVRARNPLELSLPPLLSVGRRSPAAPNSPGPSYGRVIAPSDTTRLIEPESPFSGGKPGVESLRFLSQAAERLDIRPNSGAQSGQEGGPKGGGFALTRLQHRQSENVRLTLEKPFIARHAAVDA